MPWQYNTKLFCLPSNNDNTTLSFFLPALKYTFPARHCSICDTNNCSVQEWHLRYIAKKFKWPLRQSLYWKAHFTFRYSRNNSRDCNNYAYANCFIYIILWMLAQMVKLAEIGCVAFCIDLCWFSCLNNFVISIN